MKTMHSTLLGAAKQPLMRLHVANRYQAPQLHQLVFLPNKNVAIELLIEVLRFYCHLNEQQTLTALQRFYAGERVVVLSALSFDVATTKIAQISAYAAANEQALVCQLGVVNG